MYARNISDKLKLLSKEYPIITITGPRQSGKTTICKNFFNNKDYVTLEDLDIRNFASKDPRGFLSGFPNGVIIDEIQRAPELLSYIQTFSDEMNKTGFYILTGSQQFHLLEKVTQSLAGRTALIKLLPLCYGEIYKSNVKKPSIEELLYRGFYPRIFDKKLNPTEAMSFYVETYIQRDLRNMLNIKDLSKFEIFLKLCAGRVGQILNLSNLGNDCGVNHSTIKSWISVLEASYIIKLLKPYYKNFRKRLMQSPKLYFLDTGLVCYLLGIENENQLKNHPLKGSLFESFVVSEFLKNRFNQVKIDNLYYIRDNIGNEVDIVLEYGNVIDLVEIKSSQTISSDFFKGITYFKNLSKIVRNSYIIYGGNRSYTQQDVNILSYKQIANLIL